jgi:serine/threonine-protein kinase
MIDGRGRVKITDFGLAGLAEGIGEHEIRSGTPAYMAPEQLAGRQVSTRSDIYALGLVLYELVTGRPAFSGKSIAEISRRQQETQPTIPSSLISDMDDATERVILRCLKKDPQMRPPSALAVAAALPGGDPLAAALAAGETPSPELVAEAGEAGGLKPLWASVLLAISFAGLLFMAWNGQTLERFIPLDLSADELTVKADQAFADLGHTELPRSRMRGFDADHTYLRWMRDNVKTKDRWEALRTARPPAVHFYYRYNPKPLWPLEVHAYRVTDSDPPLEEPGSAVLRLDTLGRLAGLDAIPADLGVAGAPPFDWSVAFGIAGLSMGDFEETEPVKPASSPTSELRAWASTGGETATIVQMGAVGSRLTYYEVLGPWNRPGDDAGDSGGSSIDWIFGFVIAAMIIAALFLAYHNLRAGRGDTKGAFRIAMFTIVTMQLAWLLVGVRLQSLEIGPLFGDIVFGRSLGHALLHAALAWMLYVALEPYVRRLWPHTLVSWTRLLRGRLRDPLIGRDILIGHAVGLLVLVLTRLGFIVVHLTDGALDPIPSWTTFAWLGDLGPRDTLAGFLSGIQVAAYVPLGLTVLLLLLRMLVRRDWATIVTFALLFGIAGALDNPSWSTYPLAIRALIVAISVATLTIFAGTVLRVGLLTFIAAFGFMDLTHAPMTLDLSAW